MSSAASSGQSNRSSVAVEGDRISVGELRVPSDENTKSPSLFVL